MKVKVLVYALSLLLATCGIIAVAVAGGPDEDIETKPVDDPGGSGGASCKACEIQTSGGDIISVSCILSSPGSRDCEATWSGGTASCDLSGGSC